MVLNLMSQVTTIGIALLFAFGITYVISKLLMRVKKVLVFLLPVIFFSAAVIFWILGLLSNSWGALGLLLYASFSTIAFIGSMSSSLFIYYRSKRPIDDN